LKKSSKKLLIILAAAYPERLSPDSQKFFGSFFQKRTCFLSDVATCYPHAAQRATGLPQRG
jgi:hypothetical protein